MDLVTIDGRKNTFRNPQALDALAGGLAPEAEGQ